MITMAAPQAVSSVISHFSYIWKTSNYTEGGTISNVQPETPVQQTCKTVYPKTAATKWWPMTFPFTSVLWLSCMYNNLAKDIVDTLHQVHGDVCTNDGSVWHWVIHLNDVNLLCNGQPWIVTRKLKQSLKMAE